MVIAGRSVGTSGASTTSSLAATTSAVFLAFVACLQAFAFAFCSSVLGVRLCVPSFCLPLSDWHWSD